MKVVKTKKPSRLKKWLWVAVISTILVILIPIVKINNIIKRDDVSKPVEVVEVSNQSTIDSLTSIIDGYKKERESLDITINNLNRQVSDLQTTVSSRESTIKQLKQGTNEKVSNISSFTNSDIYKLLSERYKDSTSVK